MKLAIVFAFFSSTAFAGQNFEIQSDKGKKVTLSFNEENITTDTGEAVICSTPAAKVVEAKLWMNMGHHGHGSGPTTIAEGENGCYDITRIDFSMPGKWEIRVKFEDADKGVFNLEVK